MRTIRAGARASLGRLRPGIAFSFASKLAFVNRRRGSGGSAPPSAYRIEMPQNCPRQ